MENKLTTKYNYIVNENAAPLIMTADEMFAELGYKKISDSEYERIEPDRNGREVFIIIDAKRDKDAIKYIKDKKLNVSIAEWISNEELKAICKKMEEWEGYEN